MIGFRLTYTNYNINNDLQTWEFGVKHMDAVDSVDMDMLDFEYAE